MKASLNSLIILIATAGCSTFVPEETDRVLLDRVADSKIIGRGGLTDAGKIIVNVDDEAASELERGDMSFLEELEGNLGAVSVRRVFPPVPRTEEKARRYGLHKWYVLELEDGTDVEAAAGLLAGLGQVNKVQFCTVMHKASDGVSHPYIHAGTKSFTPVAEVMNDPYGGDQWHYANDGDIRIAPTAAAGADISLTDAWRLCSGDPSVIVAVLDEGVQYSHPDLAGNMWLNPHPGLDGYADDNFGYNFAGNGRISWNTMGSSGHGTHVAGTVAAVNNNGTGVCGVAGGNGYGNGVRIMSCQIFDGFSGGTPDVVAEAAKYAADHGASILQCSFGVTSGAYRNDAQYSRFNGVEHDAFRYFMETSNCSAMDGGLIVFAAGNDSSPMAGYPGAYMDYICVTSFAADNLPAYYTNYGPGSNISAPGGEYGTGQISAVGDQSRSEVLSTMPTRSFTLYLKDEAGQIYEAGQTAANYGYMQGTSMACPHVSGVAALGLSYALRLGRHFTHEEMVSMILTSVDEMDSRLAGAKSAVPSGTFSLENYSGKMGTGTINAWKLLMQIEGTPYIVTKAGEELAVELDDYFGGNASGLAFSRVSISEEDITALGIESFPEIRSGRLYITPTKAGAGKFTVYAIAGGDSPGGGNSIGGMEISRKISVIAREMTNLNGGWL